MYADIFKLPETNFKFALGAERCPNDPTKVTPSKRKNDTKMITKTGLFQKNVEISKFWAPKVPIMKIAAWQRPQQTKKMFFVKKK